MSLILPMAVILVVAFLLLFLVARLIDNFGVVDIAWAGAFTPVVATFALEGHGDPRHRVLLAVMVAGWSLRLALMLARRVIGHHPVEDARYTRLRQEWAGRLNLTMAGFFVLQALLVVLLTAPFALAVDAVRPGWSAWDAVAVALWVVAVIGEHTADEQLAAFKSDPANRGRVCDRGLWRYSRHPNYFFEWLVWVAFALALTPVPLGWVAWGGPLLMGYFLRFVTGVRYTEEQLLRSKGDAYRDYQRRTSAFFPWPPAS